MPEIDATSGFDADEALPETEPGQVAAELESSRKATPPGPGFWASLGLTILLFFLVQAFGIGLTVGLMFVGFALDETLWAMFIASGVLISLLSVALSLGNLGPSVLRRLAVTRPSALHVALTVLLVAPLASILQEIGAWAGEVLPSFNAEYYEEFATLPWLVVVIFGCVLPAFGEEIFFRGLLGRGLIARLGIVAGTLWGSVLFAAIHVDPTQAVAIVFIGIALQLTMLASRSILVPMLLHFLNNLLSFVLMKTGYYADVDHLSPPVIATGFLAVLTVAALLWQTRARWVLPNGEAWTPGYLTSEKPPAAIQANLVPRRASIVLLLAALAAQAAFWVVAVRGAQLEEFEPLATAAAQSVK